MAGFAFTGVSGLSGATIDAADFQLEEYSFSTDANTKNNVYADDSEAPTAPANRSQHVSKTRTTAFVALDGDPGGVGFHPLEIKTVIQELADSYDPSAIQILQDDNVSPTSNLHRSHTYDEETTHAAKLDIDYTAAGNSAPTAPTTLFVGETDAQTGTTDPINVGDRTPMFSAICNDPDSGDILNKYQIEVDNNSDFLSIEWDSGSGGTSMTNCTESNRSVNIEFGGTALAFDGQTHYWRIRFWDDDNTAGTKSDGTATFQMLGPGKQMRGGKYFFNATTRRIFSW